ncbi:hypothetical protein FACS1894176_09990 [Bacteroidia bacterium]|nr:hypothetical protein FACS1894176_09990 [Bacteroidia bacterium]
MKRILFFVAIALVSYNVVSAQDTTSVKSSLTLSGDVRTGSGYAPLFGLKTSDKWSAYYMVDVQHSSGLGIGGYRMTDFQQEGLGKLAFFDLYWSGNLSKNLSLYGAVEYGFFDNDNQMSFWCPYVILFWSNPVVNVNFSPMYCYYDKLKSDEIIVRLQATKALCKNTEIQLSGWYDNTLNKKFYGAVGITQKLPKNFYVQGDLLFREGESLPMINLGYKF